MAAYSSDRDKESTFRFPSEDTLRGFVNDEQSADEMVQFAENLGRHLQEKKVTSSQIRNAYGGVKKMEMSGWGPTTRRHLLLIKPRLAYAAGRHRNGLTELKQVMDTVIDAVVGPLEFQRFCQFFEAILAYHRAFGGK